MNQKSQIQKTIDELVDEVKRLEAQNQELVEALREVVAYCEEHGHSWSVLAQTKAAIARANRRAS